MRSLDLDTDKIKAHIDSAGVGWVLFNNPARHNAMSLEMWQGLGNSLERFRTDPDVRPFVPKLTEEGMRHPVTRLTGDPAENAAWWERLPATLVTKKVVS